MEEFFDVCTPEGTPTGQSVPRSQAHRLGLWHRSSHLWVINSNSQLLLQKRHPLKETDPGRWDIAVAGHLSAGQTPLEALVREAREELGLVLDPQTLQFLEARPKQYVESGFIDREWQHLFVVQWDGDLESLALQADEVTEVRWMPLAEYRIVVEADDERYVDRKDDWGSFARWLASVYGDLFVPWKPSEA